MRLGVCLRYPWTQIPIIDRLLPDPQLIHLCPGRASAEAHGDVQMQGCTPFSWLPDARSFDKGSVLRPGGSVPANRVCQ